MVAKGNDIISFTSDGNTVLGGAGDDTIVGFSASSTVEGGAGADSLTGSAGHLLSYESSDAAVTINLNNGSAAGGHATGDVIDGYTQLLGSAHADTLRGEKPATMC